MKKLPLFLAVSAAAALAACATSEPVRPVPTATVPPGSTVVTTPPAAGGGNVVVVPPQPAAPPATVAIATLRTGYGRVETINRMTDGPSQGTGLAPMRRVGLRMEDGTAQFVDTRAENLSIGDRVEIAGDGRIRYPVP